ncbi:MAG: hypothetical protein J7K33_05385, partial [Candidatus Marinimicrobia bacterium]|nr:hypothetical protein [Candidatus Neomarinimicrobiota bacterium]
YLLTPLSHPRYPYITQITQRSCNILPDSIPSTFDRRKPLVRFIPDNSVPLLNESLLKTIFED